jgi:hypothetical protein
MLPQMNRSGRFGAKGDTVNTSHKIKAATATLTVGFLLAIALAATAQAANGTSQAVRARADATNRFYQLGVYSPEELRSQAMIRAYHLGAYSSTGTAAQKAVERRSQAINRFYHTGSSTAVSTSSPFDWSTAGISAGGALGLIVLAGGLTVLVRRRTTDQPSSPSTA